LLCKSQRATTLSISPLARLGSSPLFSTRRRCRLCALLFVRRATT
jgi:hypothetical protein